MRTYDFLVLLLGAQPRQHITTAACRERAYSQLTANYSPAAQQQPQAAPCACGRSTLCYRSLLHRNLQSITRLHHHHLCRCCLLCDRIIQPKTAVSLSQTTDSKNSSSAESVLTPGWLPITSPPPSTSSSRQPHARVANPLCTAVGCFYRSLRSISRPGYALSLCGCCCCYYY